jgi:putative glutamate/gamma-aminobutyrate antiporter
MTASAVKHAPDSKAAGKGRMLSWETFAFLTVASLVSIAQLPAAAEYGLGAVTLYLLPALLFLIPVALVAAELATARSGGVFDWVAAGMNERMGFQAIWLQWIQSVALYPSLLSFAAASLAYAIGRSDLVNNGVYTGVVVLIIFWAATLIALRGLSATARISSWGVIIGTLIPAVALIGLMFVWLGGGKTSHVSLHAASIVPPFAGLSSIVLIVSNFIALGGLEVSAVHIRDMRRPVSDYLKAVTVAVVVGLLIYIPGTVAVSVAVPAKQIDLNAGTAQAFASFTAGLGVGWLGPILSALLLIGALAGSLSWVAGPSRGLLFVGQQGYLPPLFQRVNRAGVQAPIMLAQAAIVTVLAVLFVVIPGVSAAFWVLQAMTAILYLLMYVLMFAAAWRLRIKQPDLPRQFRVPLLPLVASVGILASITGIAIGLVPPAQFKEGPPVTYALVLIGGVALLALPPQIIYQLRRPSWRDAATAATTELESPAA